MRLFILVLVVMLAGCGGETPVEKAEEKAGVEEIEETTTSSVPESLRIACQANKAEQDGFDIDALGTQLGEAVAAKQFPESAPTPDPEIQQAVSEGKTLGDILEDRGYTCSDEEIRELQQEETEQAEQMQQKSSEQEKQSGVNEAGQDVSNIPEMSPEERRAEAECLNGYYRSLPPEQRGSEQQRVTAEANDRGVTPGEVVGCDREAGLSPTELDAIHEKPNPKNLTAQCSPQSNASPAFREKYC